ncbi:MAG: metallophosphoesterase [Saprospiraceae bacterium]
MHIILVADLHLSSSPADSFGIDTVANFERVISRIIAHQPDHIVMMGDYSLKAPMRQDVERVHARLTEVGVPFSFISGNHDNSIDVAGVCCENTPPVDGELYYRKDLNGSSCLFLDTAKGHISETQKTWLANELSDEQRTTHVFMHHPPIHMGVPFMDDNHAISDEGGELFEILFSGNRPVHVYSGHYHTARSTQVGIHSVHLCPSTYFQLDPNLKEFGVSHSMPGIRHVQMIGNQTRSWIEFLPKRG